jgi:hypothetical protein
MEETMLTPEQALDISTREDALTQWRGKRCSYAVGEPEAAGLHPPTNDERSALEVYEFITNPPQRYFLYIKRPEVPKGYTLGFQRTIATTWTGDKLGDVQCGSMYRSNFGDRRIPITVYAINGKVYHGTYYCDAGDYARIKLAKHQKENQ